MHLIFSDRVNGGHHNQDIRAAFLEDDRRVILHIHRDPVFIVCKKLSGLIGCFDPLRHSGGNLAPVSRNLSSQGFHDPFGCFFVDIGTLINFSQHTAAVLRRGVVFLPVFLQHLTFQRAGFKSVCPDELIDGIHTEDIDQSVGRIIVALGNHCIELVGIIIRDLAFLNLFKIAARNEQLDQTG